MNTYNINATLYTDAVFQILASSENSAAKIAEDEMMRICPVVSPAALHIGFSQCQVYSNACDYIGGNAITEISNQTGNNSDINGLKVYDVFLIFSVDFSGEIGSNNREDIETVLCRKCGLLVDFEYSTENHSVLYHEVGSCNDFQVEDISNVNSELCAA